MLHCDASYCCFAPTLSTNHAIIREFTYRQKIERSELSVRLSVVGTNLELTAVEPAEIDGRAHRTVLLAKLVETVSLG